MTVNVRKGRIFLNSIGQEKYIGWREGFMKYRYRCKEGDKEGWHADGSLLVTGPGFYPLVAEKGQAMPPPPVAAPQPTTRLPQPTGRSPIAPRSRVIVEKGRHYFKWDQTIVTIGHQDGNIFKVKEGDKEGWFESGQFHDALVDQNTALIGEIPDFIMQRLNDVSKG